MPLDHLIGMKRQVQCGNPVEGWVWNTCSITATANCTILVILKSLANSCDVVHWSSSSSPPRPSLILVMAGPCLPILPDITVNCCECWTSYIRINFPEPPKNSSDTVTAMVFCWVENWGLSVFGCQSKISEDWITTYSSSFILNPVMCHFTPHFILLHNT